MDVKTFKIVFNGFENISDEKIEYFLSYSDSRINRVAWRHNGDMAQGLLCAHMLTVLDADEAKNANITSETRGGISVSYAQGENLDKTNYGKMFTELQNSTIIPVMVC